MAAAPFRVLETCWSESQSALSAVRRTVFIGEQGVPEALEWDDDDAPSQHFLALAPDGSAVGCARLLPDGHIGRMAVLPGWRGQGVGHALLDAALAAARQKGHSVVRLSAQTHAAGFYRRFGFSAVGEEYAEAGIAHVAMCRALD